MKFVLACYGTRGDVEPCAAVGRELLRRGHDVRTAVAPDLLGFAESAGLPAVTYGPDARKWQDLHRDVLTHMSRKFWKVPELVRLVRQDRELFDQCWDDTRTTLMSLADGADLLLTVVIAEQVAANIAEYYDIPLATLHTVPMRANGQLIPVLPAPLAWSAMTVSEWLGWPAVKRLEDAQRRELGLPKVMGPASRRIAERGSLEIQAYDEVCFPGLAAEWAKFGGQRPFVGALATELATDADEEVASWIAAGTPPILFGFGSTLVKSPADTVAMISAACAELGERALICSGATDFSQVAHSDHVKVVGAVSYAATFSACRAVVHHGGAGTTAVGLRSGVPTLVLSTWGDQTIWGTRIKQLKVGTARRFSATTRESLVEDLRTILAPECLARARELATRMSKPAESVTAAADLMENFARTRRIG
ncbi:MULTISPECIES: glycosyltransferase [unclassified Mycobacterium]|uniref:glycosyltransferase n=1 Tax=unclassified Mycobacterium TaxID=2642494 RepID=UPI00073FD928|nr:MULTISPECIES: glycosyltransferase [unclassified Mycobacterium]KUH80908.1 glycosyl transferase family 1 [Mycobacterium sp. GA-0227b]KUH92297.1 glycosyl transferase family 1 [Mycobacterium sp. GA-1999]KUH94619.1 glycosyl transferase family 1 [Mycobacterium sp. IS-1556]